MKTHVHFLFLLLAMLCPSLVFAQANDEFDKVLKRPIYMATEIDLDKNFFESMIKSGFIFTAGNTQSVSINIDSYLTYRIKRFENYLRFGMYFTHVDETTTSSSTGTITDFIFGSYRLDYYFHPRTTVFIGGGGYTDDIKGIDVAGEAFVGVSHFLLQDPKYSLRLSGGYNFTYEDRRDPFPSQEVHSASFELKYRHDFNKMLSLSNELTLDQNVAKIEDFRVANDTDFNVRISRIFSLIFGVHARFDNNPVPGFRKLDLINDISIGARF